MILLIYNAVDNSWRLEWTPGMARKLRIQYAGAMYHVMNRGDRREEIFRDEEDRKCFLATLGEVCAKTDWRVHAFCLMINHFHLVIETPQANLVDGMKWFLGTYTSRFNGRHRIVGHLFSGRYKALIVDGSGTGYLKTACDYVHLNPVRAKLLTPEEPLETFIWSSYPHYLSEPSIRPPWLTVERLFGESGIPKDSRAGRKQFSRQMEVRRKLEEGGEFDVVRKGWYLGSEEFRRELLAQVSEKRGPWHYGTELGESAEVKAEKLIEAELRVKSSTEDALQASPKVDSFKLHLARKLRAETTVTVGWIAKRLNTGSRGYLAHLLSKKRSPEEGAKGPVNSWHSTISLTDPVGIRAARAQCH